MNVTVAELMCYPVKGCAGVSLRTASMSWLVRARRRTIVSSSGANASRTPAGVASRCSRQAIAADDPVLYFEPKRRYHAKGEVEEVLGDSMENATLVAAGTDVTLVTYGALVATARDAALAAADDGISVEVIDLRSLAPVDYPTIEASVRKTGRLVVTHEAIRSGGLGGEIIATITERCFEFLEAAPVRVTGFDIPYPVAKLESHHLPGLDRMLDGIDRVMGRRS